MSKTSTHCFNISFYVTVDEDTKEITGSFDWSDSYYDSWDENGDGTDDVRDLGTERIIPLVDRWLAERRLPDGDWKPYTPEEIEGALKFLTTLTNTDTHTEP